MLNYKLLIQYDGTNYSGWQMQSNARSIQAEIAEAIKTFTKEEVNLIGSGRTDAGVHALGQTANFRYGKKIDLYKFTYSLNALLPKDIAVLKAEQVGEKFHARFDAKSRYYLYLITQMKSPFYRRYSYQYHGKLNIAKLNELSKVFLGENDFSSFAKKSSELENKACTVHTAQWRRSGGMLLFLIEANRFLHGMVRTIVGTLIEAVEKEISADDLKEIIFSKDRKRAGFAAPAKGLFLYKVKY